VVENFSSDPAGAEREICSKGNSGEMVITSARILPMKSLDL
jgi:hypothetical protein